MKLLEIMVSGVRYCIALAGGMPGEQKLRRGRRARYASCDVDGAEHIELQAPRPTREVGTRGCACFSSCTVVACTIVFFFEMKRCNWVFLPLACPDDVAGGTQPCESNLLLGPPRAVLDEMGAKNGDAIFRQGEWWRILTCNWLHGGVIHLISNLVGVMHLGSTLEREYGGLAVGTVYILSGIVGVSLSLLFLPDVLTVG